MNGGASIAERLPNSLIALDFDGPIAPIVDRPEKSRPVESASDVLHQLSALGATVAIVTGRDAATVLELSGLEGLPGLIVRGVHGAQWWQDGHLTEITEPEGLGQLRAQLPAVCAAVDDAVLIEDKGLSLVLHVRAARDPAAALEQLRARLEGAAAEHGVELHDGKMVLELRAPGIDKGTAMRELLARFEPDAALFAGDDVGDVPGMLALREWAQATGNPSLSVAVGEHETVTAVADAHTPDANTLMDLLATLLEDQ